MTHGRPSPPGLHRIPLSGWTLRVDDDGPTPMPPQARYLLERVIAATVPGAVHGDLQDAGLVDDPLHGTNELAAAWVSRTDWVYECDTPSVGSVERVDLVFDGLDTVAVIELDGSEIGHSRNMHRSYRYDVTDALRAAGTHRLRVRLSSAYTEAEALRARLGPRPNAYPEPFNFIRKMACSFGWDWGPTVAGAGIWRPARIETWTSARIARLRPLVDVTDGIGTLTAQLDVERATSGGAATLAAEVLLDGNMVARTELAPGTTSTTLRIEVPQVRVWQPRGYGTAELYRLEVRLADDQGAVLDRSVRRIGFRHLELDRTPDPAGTPFLFRLNGSPVLIKGVNWIPDDVLPGRMTRERYRTRLWQAADAGVNLIRVWGGGLYESDDFYDTCDEIGLLVWQDFPFACAAYPEDDELRGEVLAEAAENVARLASHPSLVLWNGNNENLWLHEAEGWARQPGGDRPWGERYYLEDLPQIVAEVDPSRPYTPGSPWSGSSTITPNDPAHQTFHSWDVWNRQDYAHYRDSTPRFVAEFGWQAPPAWTTLADAVDEEPVTPDSPGVRHHQKAADGMTKLRRGLAAHVPVPDDVHAWHYLTQLIQVRAIETGVLHWRSHWPHTAGTILWQLNDIWPALSWSAIDAAGRFKPLYHAVRELYADRAVTVQPDRDGLVLCALNDSAEPWAGEAVARRVSDHGVERAVTSIPVRVAPRAVTRVPLPAHLAAFDDPRREVLVVDLDDRRACWYALEPKDSDFSGSAPDIAIAGTADGLRISVTARSLLRDFLVQADRMHPDASADRGFVTLLPGESTTVMVHCPQPLSPEAARRPWTMAWLDQVIRR
jgi:beta-mannosidase